jgi:hypothetical protein
VSAGRSLELPPDPGDGGDVLVVEWVDEVLPDGVLEGPADLGSVTTPASVKLMSEIRPSAWSAPRCRYPASLQPTPASACSRAIPDHAATLIQNKPGPAGRTVFTVLITRRSSSM